MVDDGPVSFTSAYLRTHTHFDISVDTLEPYRNRGLARMTAALLIGAAPLQGLSPHWERWIPTLLPGAPANRSVFVRPVICGWPASVTVDGCQHDP
ncbi:MAG: GNAT family N-acetyltransferase [Uliginosibacterium sp.]|nr:GNAT family N-acetyltransferase [Uliginosibacterium sp.]